MIDELLPPPTAEVTRPAFRWVRSGLGLAALGTLFEYTPRLWSVAQPANVQLPYASWLPEASPVLATALWIGWLVNAGLFTLGRHRPYSGLLLGACVAAVLASDQQWYSNHLYLIAMLAPLLALAECEGERVRLLPIRVVQGLVVVVYGFAGLAKLDASFLSGAVLADYVARGALPHSALRIASWATVTAELALGPLLVIERTRRLGWALGVALHAGMVALAADERLGIAMFALAMLSTYPLFAVREASA